MQLPFTFRAPIRLILGVAIAFALSTWIDPYVGFGSLLAVQAVNAVVPVIVMLLAWAVGGRVWLALVVEAILLCILRYAGQVKLMYLDTDLVYADLTVVGGLLKEPQLILGFLHPSAKKIAAVVILLVGAVLTAWFARRQGAVGWKFRLVCAVIALAGAAMVGTLRAPDVVRPLHWDVYAQAHGASFVGIAGNMLLGRMTARDVRRPPDPKAEQAFWNEPLVRKAGQAISKDGNGMRPDIVIVQSESLFEPSQLCGFSDTPVLQNVAKQQPVLPGNLHVPVFGGRTLQTEFEMLAGAPISYYPGSMFAYYELVDHRFDALPHVLKGFGYKTVLIHPNSRGFWRREVVMPDMGFGTFQDIGSFLEPRDFTERNHVSDGAMTRAILAELDSSNRPAFVVGISMNNHGPWGAFAPEDDSNLGLPAALTGEARAEMADYVAHAIDADKAYGYLLDALARRGRPTVVAFYGDHLPALSPVYEQLCFKDGKPPQEHYPPYRIWANFPMPQPPATTSAYLLQGWLMHVAGLPLKGHELANALAGMVAHDPAASQADRQRVLDEYANIAAANVASLVPAPPGTGRVFVDREHALEMLMKQQRPEGAAGTVKVRNGDLYLQPQNASSARIEFNTGGAVSSLTLRPYLGFSSMGCATTLSSRTWFSVEGDGRELYRAYLTRKTFRMATLDLSGVKQLTLHVDGGTGEQAASCGRVHVRVAQILCYSARCDVPSSAPVSADMAKPSRILSVDPMTGDIAALDSLESVYRARVDSRMENIEWLFDREKDGQKGAADFSIQSDGRLFMHPAGDHDAWIDFDLNGVDSIELAPHINTLDKTCEAMNAPGAEAGVVGLTVLLDGKPLLPRTLVDRHYDKVLSLNVKDGHILRVDVDKGNRVTSCDWFSVGVPKLTWSLMSDTSATN